MRPEQRRAAAEHVRLAEVQEERPLPREALAALRGLEAGRVAESRVAHRDGLAEPDTRRRVVRA